MMLRRSLTGSNAVKMHLWVVIYSQLPKKFDQVQFPSKERKCMRAERKSRPYFPLLSWSRLQPKIFLTTLGKEVSIPLKGCANFSFTSCFINVDKMQWCGLCWTLLSVWHKINDIIYAIYMYARKMSKREMNNLEIPKRVPKGDWWSQFYS